MSFQATCSISYIWWLCGLHNVLVAVDKCLRHVADDVDDVPDPGHQPGDELPGWVFGGPMVSSEQCTFYHYIGFDSHPPLRYKHQTKSAAAAGVERQPGLFPPVRKIPRTEVTSVAAPQFKGIEDAVSSSPASQRNADSTVIARTATSTSMRPSVYSTSPEVCIYIFASWCWCFC